MFFYIGAKPVFCASSSKDLFLQYHPSQSSKLSSIGALKEMLEGDKEKVARELLEEEEKVKAKEEKAAKKGKRRADPNNPTKEEVEAEQEVHEKLTWQDR